MNFITNLFSSVRRKANYNSIFIVMNYYFRFARYIVGKKNWNAKNSTKMMIKQIFSIFAMFMNTIFNRNSLFILNYWSTLNFLLNNSLICTRVLKFTNLKEKVKKRIKNVNKFQIKYYNKRYNSQFCEQKITGC